MGMAAVTFFENTIIYIGTRDLEENLHIGTAPKQDREKFHVRLQGIPGDMVILPSGKRGTGRRVRFCYETLTS
jgi:hypothetical protein